MAATITKAADGDLSRGNLRGELITLKPAVSDYATGGYLLQGIGGTTEGTGNVGLDKILWVTPVGGQGGLSPVWNPTTSKLQIYQGGSSGHPENEVPPNTDLSSYSFQLLVEGL